MKLFYLLSVALLLSVTSCRTKDGEPGPAGSVGEDALSKQGSITGTLLYLDYNGDTTYKPFTYAYYETLHDSKYDENDGLKVSFRRRDLKDSEKYFSFDFRSYEDNNNIYQAPEYGTIDFSFVSVENNRLFSFSDYYYGEGYYDEVDFYDGSETLVEITNFSFDKATGRLIFDFKNTYSVYNISYDDRYDDFTQPIVTGHVDVVLNEKQSPQNIVQ